MNTLERWAEIEETEKVLTRLLGKLFLNYPSTLDQLENELQEFFYLLEILPEDHNCRVEIPKCIIAAIVMKKQMKT